MVRATFLFLANLFCRPAVFGKDVSDATHRTFVEPACTRYVLPFLLFACLVLPLVSQAQDYTWRSRLGGTGLRAVGINPLSPSTIYAEGLQVSYDAGFTWSFLGDPGISGLRQILVHPSDTSVIFCLGLSGAGGLRRSSDHGLTWTEVIPELEVDGETLAFDPSHPDTLFVANFYDGATYKSTDRGITWEFRSYAGDFICALTVRPDSANILYAGTGNGTISKSSDAGLTWRLVKEEGAAETPHISVDPFNPFTAYATAWGGLDSTTGVWKTTDGGENWSLTDLTGISVWSMDVDRTNAGVVYAGRFDLEGAGVFKTTNGGTSWDTLSGGLPVISQSSNLKVHPLNSQMIWAAMSDGIYRWTQLRSTIQGTVFDGATGDTVTNGFIENVSTGEQVLLDTSRGTFSLHYYDGDPFLSSTVHIEAFPYYLKDEAVEFVLDSVITHDLFLIRLPLTSVAGTVEDSISHALLSADVTLTSTSSAGDMSYFASTDSNGSFEIDNLFISHPPIISYDAIVFEPAFPHGVSTFRPVVLDTVRYIQNAFLDTADVMITASPGSGDYASYHAEALDSLGLAHYFWDPSVQGIASLSRTQELRKGLLIYYTGDDTAALSQNEIDSLENALQLGIPTFITGQNFVEANGLSTLLSQVLGVAHTQNTSATACRGTEGDLFSDLLMFTFGGTGASNQNSRDVIQILGSLAVPTFGYGPLGNMGTAGVRLDSVGSGAKVVLFGFGFEAISSRETRETVMRTIIGYFDGSILLGVDEHPDAQPLSYRLDQNYPNPFNGISNFEFHLPALSGEEGQAGISKLSSVSLVVYDLLGREVATLVNEKLAAGTYTRTWDATGQPSGVYFYRLSAGDFVETKKLVLLK